MAHAQGSGGGAADIAQTTALQRKPHIRHIEQPGAEE
jgi:hypothetical protein